MAEICPLINGEGWIYCHDGKPSVWDDKPGEHICKAWGAVGFTMETDDGLKRGCKLIERGYK